MMGKEAGNGRDLSKGWRKAKVLPWPFTFLSTSSTAEQG